MYLTAGSIYLIIERPGRREHYWQLLAEGQGESPPRPGSSYLLLLGVGDTGEASTLDEGTVEVADADDGIVEPRGGGSQ